MCYLHVNWLGDIVDSRFKVTNLSMSNPKFSTSKMVLIYHAGEHYSGGEAEGPSSGIQASNLTTFCMQQ